MMKRSGPAFARGLVAVAILVTTGPGVAGDSPAAAEPPAVAPPANVANPAIPEGATRIGEAVTVATPPIRLGALRKNPPAYFEKTLLVEATIAAVCQTRGCWMTIEEPGTEPIWVRWSTGCGGKYAFPKDGAGRRVLVQGSFYAKQIAPADAEHLAAESKSLAAKDISLQTYEMNATACVLLPAAPGPEADPAK